MSVLLIAEHNNKELKSFTLNAVTAASQIDNDVHALVIGNDCADAAKAASELPLVKKVITVEAPHYQNFIAENPQEVDGICMYLESLIGLNEISLAEDFLDSLSMEIGETEKVKKIKDKMLFIKNTDKGPSLDKLKENLEIAPNNIDIVFQITDTHFANNNYDNCFNMLLSYYPKNKEKIKIKMLDYFGVLGFDHESTILYRKKLSSIMFS